MYQTPVTKTDLNMTPMSSLIYQQYLTTVAGQPIFPPVVPPVFLPISEPSWCLESVRESIAERLKVLYQRREAHKRKIVKMDRLLALETPSCLSALERRQRRLKSRQAQLALEDNAELRRKVPDAAVKLAAFMSAATPVSLKPPVMDRKQRREIWLERCKYTLWARADEDLRFVLTVNTFLKPKDLVGLFKHRRTGSRPVGTIVSPAYVLPSSRVPKTSRSRRFSPYHSEAEAWVWNSYTKRYVLQNATKDRWTTPVVCVEVPLAEESQSSIMYKSFAVLVNEARMHAFEPMAEDFTTGHFSLEANIPHELDNTLVADTTMLSPGKTSIIVIDSGVHQDPKTMFDPFSSVTTSESLTVNCVCDDDLLGTLIEKPWGNIGESMSASEALEEDLTIDDTLLGDVVGDVGEAFSMPLSSSSNTLHAADGSHPIDKIFDSLPANILKILDSVIDSTSSEGARALYHSRRANKENIILDSLDGSRRRTKGGFNYAPYDARGRARASVRIPDDAFGEVPEVIRIANCSSRRRVERSRNRNHDIDTSSLSVQKSDPSTVVSMRHPINAFRHPADIELLNRASILDSFIAKTVSAMDDDGNDERRTHEGMEEDEDSDTEIIEALDLDLDTILRPSLEVEDENAHEVTQDKTGGGNTTGPTDKDDGEEDDEAEEDDDLEVVVYPPGLEEQASAPKSLLVTDPFDILALVMGSCKIGEGPPPPPDPPDIYPSERFGDLFNK